MQEITNRDDYHNNIRTIRIGLKKPWMKDFIHTYFGKNLSAERYKKIEGRVKNYLNGVSYISGIELGLNEKIVEFYNTKNHESNARKAAKAKDGLQQESVADEG